MLDTQRNRWVKGFQMSFTPSAGSQVLPAFPLTAAKGGDSLAAQTALVTLGPEPF